MTKVATASPADADAGGLARIDDAARFLALSRTALYGLMDRGQVRYVKIGRKSRRIPWVELRRLVERGTEAQ